MERNDEGVPEPRLRPGNVLLRGPVFGVGGTVVAAMAAPAVGDHSDREEFLGGVGALSLIGGGFLLLVGLFFWSACGGDIRRVRDWRSVTSQFDGPIVVSPVSVRLGALGLVVGAAAFGLYELMDAASYGSWL
jgi:hypothetical protein